DTIRRRMQSAKLKARLNRRGDLRLLGDFLSSYRQHKPGILGAGFAGLQKVLTGGDEKGASRRF
ncbi:hypothetical protein ACPB3Z_26515, partial [Escherichia coli]